MSKLHISRKFQQALQYQNLNNAIAKPQNKIFLKGIIGSSFSFIVSNCFKSAKKPFLLIFENKEEAAYFLNDFETLLGENSVLFYPGSYRRPYQTEETNNANVLLRAKVLNQINSKKNPSLIVTFPEALFEKVVTRRGLEKQTLNISLNDNLNIEFINEVLFEHQFKRVDFVSEPGEFAVRGGIVDVFSFSNEEPFRIEFFGDQVESLRTFDVATQLSTSQLRLINIIPNVANKHVEEKRQSFLEYIANNTVVFIKNIHLVNDKIKLLYEKVTNQFNKKSGTVSFIKPNLLFTDELSVTKQLLNFILVEFGLETSLKPKVEFRYDIRPQPAFNKNINLLIENLKELDNKGFTIYICCVNKKQAKLIHDIFKDVEQTVNCRTVVLSIHQGFIDHHTNLVCYTDHQIFERYHKFYLKNGYAKKQAITLKELTKLDVGDFVTHIDHGIGKFGGLQKIEIEGKNQEAIKLLYGDRDILYLSIHSLHKITKFSGKDGKTPKLYKLGSNAWKNLKQKAKRRVKEIAFNLINLYANRKLKTGFKYSPDSYMQYELEASFVYEDTLDQNAVTQDIKRDMESDQPMDRLVCGDVGYGKTEVAIRAAFKAVDNGKQVAVLVPTTILAFQHFKTFSERLKEFPVTVDYLNRFRTAKQKKLILESLLKGSLDIVIGTHQLVNKSVKFKNLGLLIVDEEQKFGVAVKEKLKTIKENIDVLTLTATPIPRTLQFSLMAARDLSVIRTPPPNRFPIESQVVRFNKSLIRNAIIYEIQRKGQVFFIHNRIENIKEVGGMIQQLVPDAIVGVGHGQLEGRKLEQLMVSFMKGKIDVLVSTTIVENGLDVPNANTIFINYANTFGLSDLHQMRGRVGRSNKKAFCYLITPEYSAMTNDARKRITALEQYTELGSGFNIAMKDLEIRGAGDLLGGEQSGFINEIGFETYQKILNEAIEELKESKFKDLYKQSTRGEKYIKDISIDTDFELLIPDDYVNSNSERLSLYTKLNALSIEEELTSFKQELIDRFGPIPDQVEDLLNGVKVKWVASKLGFEKIVMRYGNIVGYFISDKNSTYYQSETFTNILNYVQHNQSICKIKEKQSRKGLRLLLIFEAVNTIDEALLKLNKLF